MKTVILVILFFSFLTTNAQGKTVDIDKSIAFLFYDYTPEDAPVITEVGHFLEFPANVWSRDSNFTLFFQTEKSVYISPRYDLVKKTGVAGFEIKYKKTKYSDLTPIIVVDMAAGYPYITKQDFLKLFFESVNSFRSGISGTVTIIKHPKN